MHRLLRNGSAVIAIVASAFAVKAADFEVLSARQSTPGNVVVTVALLGEMAPRVGELVLQLDNTPLVRAESVISLTTPTGPAGPVWLMLCVDRSGSIGQAVLDDLKAGLTQALIEGRTASPPFKVAIITFATQVRHVLDFTSDPTRIAAAIKGLTVDRTPGGRTLLHEAIAAGLAQLKAQGEGSRRLIVVSDGKDEGSSTSSSADRLAELAQGPPRITIDALALGPLAQDNSGSISTVAGLSGGRFLPNADSKDVTRPLQRLIADAIRLSRFDVAFQYAPATDKRTVQLAALQYTPKGGAQVRRELQAVLVAQQVAETSPKPTSSASAGSQANGKWSIDVTFKIVVDWLKNLPAAFVWLLAALLAAGLGWLGYRRLRPPGTTTTVIHHKEVKIQVNPPTPTPTPRVRAPTAVGHTWQQPAQGRPGAILRGISGTARGQMVPVDKPLFRIGCSPDNDMVLIGDDFASGAHALLRFEAGILYVEDVGSKNGTHLNGGTFKNSTRSLAPGDELTFGHTTFQVLAPQQAASGRSGLEPSPG